MGVVTVIYTVIGGLTFVVWNDCIQFVIYMLEASRQVFVIADRIPGHWDSIWTFASANNKLYPFDFQFQLNNPTPSGLA